MEEMWTLDQALIWVATRNRELASNLDLLWVDLISALSGMGMSDLPGPVQPDRRPDQVTTEGPILDWPRTEAQVIEALRERSITADRIASFGPEFAGATISFDARLRARITLLPPPHRGSSDDISASPLERPRFSPGEWHEHPWFAPKNVMAAFPPPAAASPSIAPPQMHEIERGAQAGAALRKRGRPAAADWKHVGQEVNRLMDYHGDFVPGDAEWNAQARLEEKIAESLGVQVSESVLREYVAKAVADWRTSKAGK